MAFRFQLVMALSIQRMSLLILITTQCCLAANIILLYFPVLGHITGPANVADVLQDQGHNVTAVIPLQLQDKLKGKRMDILIYDSLGVLNVNKEIENIVLERYFQGTFFPIPDLYMLNLFEEISDKILRDQQLLEKIRARGPDLIILDSTAPARMLTIIAYKLDIPFIFMGLFMEPQFSRTPLLPSVVPNKALGFTDQMTFLQRLLNTLTEFMMYFYDPCSFVDVNIYAPEKPYISMHNLQAKALLWITMEDSILGYGAPSMPNVKQVSHMLTVTPKRLPHEFQFFMDNAKDGVVIVSFGSILQSLPPVIVDKLLKAFKKTKYNFIIRHPILNSGDQDKMLFSNWLPQYDLLCHKNTILFITHCGSNGQQESILAGIPMIGFPLFADQPYNAGRIVRKGFGLRLDLRNFSVEKLVSTIEEVITNPEYKLRAQKAAAIIQSQRVPPVEEAAFWINHVLTFGGDHLRSFGQDIPLWQYLGLDVLVVCLLVCHILGFIFIKMTLCFCTFWCFKMKVKIKKK